MPCRVVGALLMGVVGMGIMVMPLFPPAPASGAIKWRYHVN